LFGLTVHLFVEYVGSFKLSGFKNENWSLVSQAILTFSLCQQKYFK